MNTLILLSGTFSSFWLCEAIARRYRWGSGFWLFILFWLVLIFALAQKVSAQDDDSRPVPVNQWTESAQMTLARTLVGEADWSEPDHAAIAHVLVKRWRRQVKHKPEGFEHFIQRYSAVWKLDTPRKRAVRALPWGEFVGPWGGKRWLKVQRFVRRWGDGLVADPCPEALHWGGTMDKPHAGWRPVRCGRTKNLFWTHENTRSRT